ncbi:unnamed protein product [Mytilus edulis]|uniref:Nucleotidyltransferase n=1 Tax=Mytilus edulis TaxID=6550 RepID=A0A8S3V4I1_MYTED|nr:unnamed protein product [Mytilus edulis]
MTTTKKDPYTVYFHFQINDTELEKVSDVVSNATFYTMASSCKTNGQKNTMLTLEYLYYTRNKGVIRRFFGGSTAEGTNVKDSDIDKMIVASNITACKDRDQSNKIEGQVFILDTSVCRPGFARLIPVKLDPNIKTIFNDHGKTIDDMLETIEGDKTFLSSDKMVDFWIDFLTKTRLQIHQQKHPVMDQEKLGASVEQDFAFGISLYEWPIDGEEWIARERKYGWPSPEFIEKITKLKCHVVAVGDKMSPTSSLEWRVSFCYKKGTDIVAHVLQCVDGVDLLSPWLDSEMKVDDFLQLCRERLDSRITTEFETYRLPLEYYHKGQGVLGVNIETVLADSKLLAEYFVGFDDHKPTTDIEDSFIEAVRMFINIRIALTHLKRVINVKDNTVKQQKLEKLQKFLEDNQNIDALSGKLYLATYWRRLQNSKKVISIIQSILDSPSQNLLYTGHCSKYMTIHIGNGTTTQLKGLPNPFDDKERISFYSSRCNIF